MPDGYRTNPIHNGNETRRRRQQPDREASLVPGFESDTWGKIDTFREFGIATQLTSLNAFSANQCLVDSGINAGASQVDYMKIDRVDYEFKSGSTDGDSTDLSVYSTQVKVNSGLDVFTLDKALAY